MEIRSHRRFLGSWRYELNTTIEGGEQDGTYPRT
jgi:hypothetical protein